MALTWGSTFILVKGELDQVSPSQFVAWRFLIASLFLGLLFFRRILGWSMKVWISGAFIGVILGLGFIFQTVGLQLTTAGKTGFLTGTQVVMVPFLVWGWMRIRPSMNAFLACGIAFVGLSLMSLNLSAENLSFGQGDLYVLASAFCFALQVVANKTLIEKPHSLSPFDIGIGQVFFATVVAVVASSLSDSWRIDFPAATWGVLVFMAVVVTGVIFVALPYLQKFTTPVETVLVFCWEPIFAALFGWWVAGEVMTSVELFGASLILVSMLVAELKLNKRVFRGHSSKSRYPRINDLGYFTGNFCFRADPSSLVRASLCFWILHSIFCLEENLRHGRATAE